MKSSSKTCVGLLPYFLLMLVCQRIVTARNFISPNGQVTVPENMTVGSTVAILEVDGDNDDVTFDIVETPNCVKHLEVRGSGKRQNLTLSLPWNRKEPDGSVLRCLFSATSKEGTIKMDRPFFILVEDVNDMPPIIDETKSTNPSLLYPENTMPDNDDPLFKVYAYDEDNGPFGTESLKFELKFENREEESKDFFRTSVTDFKSDDNDREFIIYLNKPFDYEATSMYRFRVIVSDNNGNLPCNTATYAITVNVEDVDDMPPEFIKVPPVTRIKENSPWGTEVLEVKAIDGDRSLEAAIKYSIIGGNDNDTFQILDSNEGFITVQTPPDREALQDMGFTLVILATEYDKQNRPGKTNNVSCTIIVDDENDCPPVFQYNQYFASIEENSRIGVAVNFNSTDFILVTDEDERKHAGFAVAIMDVDDPNHLFNIKPSSGILRETFVVQVANQKLLDYESLQHNPLIMKVIATDDSSEDSRDDFTANATLEIHVIDLNDNYPIFEKPLYNVSIPEHSKTGTHVALVKATDNDLTFNYGTDGIRYSLFPTQTSEKFLIDENTGNITVKDGKDLDRDKGISIHFLTVEAKDDLGQGNANTTQVVITLTDINDNPPKFLSSSYKGSLEENQNILQVPLTVKATDADEGPNKEIEFDIVQTEEEGKYFQLNKSSDDPDERLLVPKEPLNYEEICPDDQKSCTLTVIVVAKDHGVPSLSSNTTITITFMDVNDVRPKFVTQDLSNILINETAEGGTFVAQVKAVDEDVTNEFKKIAYQIVDGGNSLFTINSNNGSITTGSRANLQLTKTDITVYNLTISATDGAISNDEADSVCKVTINIKDINNEPPEFEFPRYKAFIFENATVNTILEFDRKINARDADSSAHLTYDIIYNEAEAIGPTGEDITQQEKYDSLFDVDDKGQVYVKTELDRETVSRLIMTMRVTDIAAEPPMLIQTATATLTVTIGDVNDNDPEFAPGDYSSSVRENAPVGTKIEANFDVTDKDEKNKITFSLDGNPDYLKLVQISEAGLLSVKSNIDREETAQFEVLVVATDNGDPPRSSNITFTINVTDENDNSPIFKPNSYAVFISENATVNTSVIQVNATDADEGDYGTVMYLFPNGNNNFTIDPTTGEIFVRHPLDCDDVQPHDDDLIITLVVNAADNKNNYPKHVGEAIVNITITDVNDNAPRLEAAGEKTFYENRVVSESIQSIKAIDPDKGANGTVNLTLNEDQMDPAIKGLFQIKETGRNTADIILRKSPHGKVGVWNISITPEDNGTPPKTGETLVFAIEILDINDNKPVIHDPLEGRTYSVAKDQDHFKITDINATDEDYGNNCYVTFSLIKPDNADKLFEFKKPETGTKCGGTAELYLRPDSSIPAAVYEVTIQACDKGDEPMCSLCKISVLVKDLSCYPPEFPIPNKNVTFTEELAPNSESQFLIEANDKDATEDEQVEICYYIIGNANSEKPFALIDKRQNKLTTTKKLDRETTATYTMDVFATNDCREQPELPMTTNNNASFLRVDIFVADINDNPPTFVPNYVFTGGVDNKVKLGEKVILRIRAADLDEGENAEILYYRSSDVTKYKDENMDKVDNSCFLIDEPTGDVKTGCLFGDDMKGYVEFTVSAKNRIPLVSSVSPQEATALAMIYILRVDQKLKFTVISTPEAFYKIEEQFRSTLSGYLGGVIVNLDDVQISESDNSHSDVYVHFVDRKTNEVLDPQEMRKLLDKLGETERTELIADFHIMEISNGEVKKDSNDSEQLKQILFMAAVGALGVILMVLLTAYCFRVNKLERKLKAATTSAFDNNTVTDSPTVDLPTTNMHAKDGSNPLWNYEFDGNDPRLFGSNDTDSIVSGESLVDDSKDFDGGKNNGGFPAMMETFFITETEDEPKKDDIEMQNQLNSNFSMKRPETNTNTPTSDNFTMKRPDTTTSPTSDNFTMQKQEDGFDI